MAEDPACSFVIPVLNEADIIADRLSGLREKFPRAQIIVVDGGSRDGTVQRAMPLCDQLLVTGPGRAAQMNLGACGARGTYLLFLHADTVPRFDQDTLDKSLQHSPDWGFCRLSLTGRAYAFRVIEWFINWRSRLTSVGTGDQMLFVRRDVFDAVGGFEPIPLMEDVALSKRLRRVSRPCRLPYLVETSSRRWEEGGILRTVLRMWRLRLAYFCGTSPDKLWRSYYGQ